MKPKTPKPRVMWAWPSHLNARGCPIWASRSKMHRSHTQAPLKVAVIPLVNLDDLVVKCVGAYWTGENKRPDLTREEAMRLALTAAGIPCKQRRARK